MAGLSTVANPADGLRLELKAWEAEFAASHNGQKPNRQDIKQDLNIALKYKAYASLKAPTASSPTKPKLSKRSNLKRSKSLQFSQQAGTPPKRQRFSSPSRPTNNESAVFDVPLSPDSNPNHQRTCIGPTPQKDGIVLGLFDLLSPASAEKGRWSRTASKSRHALGQIDANCEAIQTPSRKKNLSVGDEENHMIQAPIPSGHLPANSSIPSSKRAYLDAFLSTPSKRRALDTRTTPSRSGASFITFGEETPSFLRRTNSQGAISQNVIDNGDADGKPDDISWSPVRPRTKPFGRTLSALVQGLRQIEDDKADEDLDLLRELEHADPVPILKPKTSMKPTILVQDSQAVEARLGPDRGVSSDEDEVEADLERKQGKKWKKKGQKRTTRKVNIKPTTTKWRPEPKWEGTQGREGNGGNKDANALQGDIDETQRAIDDSTATDVAFKVTTEVRGAPASKISKIRAMIEKTRAAGVEEPVARKSKTKVGALAHMNFRSLNIKNKNSKGKGKGGRFGRRR